jgi:branched-chain amino acid transport system substrate-binding protein
VAATSGAIAHLGKDNENGARMAVDELNAKGLVIGGKRYKIVLQAEDDAADPKQGTAAAQKLVDAKVQRRDRPRNFGHDDPGLRIYFDAGIPQISPSASNPQYTRQGYNTAFRNIANDEQLGAALARYAVQTMQGQAIAVIDDRTAYGKGLADEFIKNVKKSGGGRRIVVHPVHQRQGHRLQRHPHRHQGHQAGPDFLRRHGRRGRPDAAPDEAAGHADQVHGRRRHVLRIRCRAWRARA